MATDGTTTETDVTLSTGKAETPQTITREVHEKALRDATTAILADVGRQKAATDNAMKVATAAQERLTRLIKQREDEELEAARDDPTELRRIRAEQRAKEAESKITTYEQELNDKTTKLTAYENREAETARETKAREVATRLNVDPARLIKLSKFTDGTPEAIEELAKELPKQGGKGGGYRPDSNASIGGGSTRDQIIAAYSQDPRDPAAREAYLELRRKEGR